MSDIEEIPALDEDHNADLEVGEEVEPEEGVIIPDLEEEGEDENEEYVEEDDDDE